jgi:hypothetical protein
VIKPLTAARALHDDRLERFTLGTWFTRRGTGAVPAHVERAFELVAYADLDD